MVNEAELIRAILESPDEDAPRLAYADACQDKSRADFIRVQLKRRAILGDIGNPRSLRYERISAELSDQYGAEWAKDIAPLVQAYSFWAGFIEEVSVSCDQFLKIAPDLFSRAPIRHLNLTSMNGRASEFSSPYLARIRSLVLDNCKLGNAEIEILSKSSLLADLRWLSLARNQIEFSGFQSMAKSTRLKSLKYVNFFGNLADPSEELSTDQGVILSARLSPDGKRLEKEFGYIRWLHCEDETVANFPPSRYSI